MCIFYRKTTIHRKVIYQEKTARNGGYMGTHGELVVIDDGTCKAQGRCKPNDEAKATAAEDGFYVLGRIDDNHIKIFVR